MNRLKGLRVVCLFIFYLWLGFVFCPQTFAGDIVIYGDSQSEEEVQGKIVQAILSFKPEAVFRVGDLVNDGTLPELWGVFNRIHGPLIKATQYYPALGNHEYDSRLYFKNFPFLNNRRWYSVDCEGIHFIILDSNSRLDLESEQYRWLKSDLAQADKTAGFIITIFHHPFFDVSDKHKSDEKNIKDPLLPLFKKYKVSVTFSGHSHNYQRFECDGIYFIVSGGGGSALYKKAQDNEYLQKFSFNYHFCLLSLANDFLVVKAIGIDNNIIDEFRVSGRRIKDVASHR